MTGTFIFHPAAQNEYQAKKKRNQKYKNNLLHKSKYSFRNQKVSQLLQFQDINFKVMVIVELAKSIQGEQKQDATK